MDFKIFSPDIKFYITIFDLGAVYKDWEKVKFSQR